MENASMWDIYRCEIVDLDTGFPQSQDVPKAVRVLRGEPTKEAAELPQGFVTYPLLDYDFSADDEVLRFINEYGIVMCPYAGAIERTFAAIEEPVIYRRLLHRVVEGRRREEPEDGGIFTWLQNHLNRPAAREELRLLDSSEDFRGCDAQWDSKRLFYEGVNSSAECEYARANGIGFIEYLEDDSRLVGTERIRALAMNEAASSRQETGVWGYPDCLISLEEVRGTLYLLQVASVVLQGFAYLDGNADERRNAGRRRQLYTDPYVPKDPLSEEWREVADVHARYLGEVRSKTRRTERLFYLFLMGRPNLLRALHSVSSWAICAPCDLASLWGICAQDGPDNRLTVPAGTLSDSECLMAEERLEAAEVRFANDRDTLELLEKRPLQETWESLEGNLATFMEACLTNCWGPKGHRLISTESFRVTGLEDGGPYFCDRMTLQRAIASQVAAYREEPGSSWQLCEECGEPYIFRNTSPKVLTAADVESREGENRKTRKRLPSAPTCSETHRMRLRRKR